MANWQRSNLRRGERLSLRSGSGTVTVDARGLDRWTHTTYEDETPAGILVRLYFEKPFYSEEPTWSYPLFITWNSIYCGDMKVRAGGEEVKAVLVGR